jgi:hypothetical protein
MRWEHDHRDCAGAGPANRIHDDHEHHSEHHSDDDELLVHHDDQHHDHLDHR